MDYIATHTSLAIFNTAWVRARLCKLQKGCIRLAAASDKVYQLLAYGRWFSPGTPASSTTKTGRHDIAEILLKVALNTNKSINLSINHIHSHTMEQSTRILHTSSNSWHFQRPAHTCCSPYAHLKHHSEMSIVLITFVSLLH